MNAGVADRDEADRLLRLLVRRRESCERCGGVGTQVAHIIGRRANATRCLEANVWFLCAPCHRRVDQNALVGHELAYATVGRREYLELREKALAGPQGPLSAFWEAEVGRLRERCEEEGVSWTH